MLKKQDANQTVKKSEPEGKFSIYCILVSTGRENEVRTELTQN